MTGITSQMRLLVKTWKAHFLACYTTPTSNEELTNMIKAVIWDMGGVIVRTEDQSSRIALAQELGVELPELYRQVFESDSARLATLGRISEEEHWRQVGDHFGYQAEKLQEFQDRFWAGDRVDLVLCEFIKRLKVKCQTGLLSNAWSGARQMLQKRLDLDALFDQSIFSAEVRMAKPGAEIYDEILKRLGVKPEEAIFVDDSAVNIEAAIQLGIKGLLFTDPNKIRAQILELLSA